MAKDRAGGKRDRGRAGSERSGGGSGSGGPAAEQERGSGTGGGRLLDRLTAAVAVLFVAALAAKEVLPSG